MNVDRNEKIWAWVGSTKIHATLGGTALCRKNIAVSASAELRGLDEFDAIYRNGTSMCKNCLKKANAMWDRAEASMQPATEADDLGYVPPMDTAHAEALQMDADGEALTQAYTEALTLLAPPPMPRWHYRAHRMTRSGQFLGVLEGYLTAPYASEVESRVRAADGSRGRDSWRLGNFCIRPATS